MTSAIAAIHAGCAQLGIDEDGRRAIYARVTGKPKLTLMTPDEQESVVLELRRMGFEPASKGKRAAKDTVTGRFADVVRAFWLSGYNLGVIRDPDDRAILTFVHGQTNLDHTAWMHRPKDANAVIEAIKAWVRRDAGLPELWRPRPGVAADHYSNDPRAQVIYAQWKLLGRMNAQPAVDLFAWVDAYNWEHPGTALAFRDGNGPVLIEMQKHLGRLIRAAKKGGAQ